MPRDYVVGFRREETLAEAALLCRKIAGHQNSAEFNIVEFIETELSKRLREKGPLRIELHDAKDGSDLAYVIFDPLTLHVDRDVWRFADLGDPFSKFVLAHEIGHLLFHGNDAKSFSGDGNRTLIAVNEQSAEWQANTFAAHLLLPDHLVAAYADPTEMARACSVELDLARERFEAVRAAKTPKPRIGGDFCIRCGEFTNRSLGNLSCPTCGQ